MGLAEDLKKALLMKSKPDVLYKAKDLLSTGSTLLNLSLSGRAFGGVPKGKYVLLVGDSDTGKSFFAMSLLAEAANSPHFKDHKLIYNDAEDGAIKDIEPMFGSKLAERIEWVSTEYTEDFYDDILERIENGEKFIYILDSETVLEARADVKKQKANRNARKTGGNEKGDYGMMKPKLNSTNLRKVRSKLRGTESILAIIAQTRDMVGGIGPGEKKTRPGGKSLKFYAIAEIWTSLRENITKKVRDKNRQLGILSKVQVKKNHINGKKREVFVPIYHSSGIDDVGSCVDYLVAEKHWKKSKAGIKAPEFDFVGPRIKLIRHIENEDLEKELRKIVSDVWKEIEEACKVERKKRYE